MASKTKKVIRTEYFLIGENGTNIIRKRGAELWCLMGPSGPGCHWENRPNLLRYFMGGKACEPINEATAKLRFADITGNQPWKD